MLVNVIGAKCIGIDAVPVTVEVDVVSGIGIHLVGLADTAVKESLLRTITALQALEYRIPGRKIVINLAPADLHKSGSGYDLPIAIGIIAASGQRVFPELGSFLVMGELGLDGTVRTIAGALPIVDFARARGMKACILPLHSALEAAEFSDIDIYGVETLADCVRILCGAEDCSDLLVRNTRLWRKLQRARHHSQAESGVMDFADIIGQEGAKRGAEIAAAGSHNLIILGMDFPPKKKLSGLLYKRRGGDSISTPSLGTCLLYFKSSSYTFSLLNFIGYNSTSSRSVIISNCSKPESPHSITSPSSFLVSLFLI